MSKLFLVYIHIKRLSKQLLGKTMKGSKKMKKRVAFVLVVLIMIVSAFIGCAKQDSQPADTGAEDTQAAATDKPAEDVGSGEVLKIDFMHFFDDTEAFYAPFQFAVEKFNEDNAGKAEIVQDILAHDAYEIQTETRGATNDLPDICLLLGTQSKKYSTTGAVLDLTQYFADSGIMDKYYPHSFTEHELDGKYYTLPLEDANYGFILYNKEIFDEVGIAKFPENQEEMIAVSKQLADAGYIPVALGDKEKWPADSLTFSTFVNPYVGNEWFEDIFKMQGNSKFTDPEFIAALTAFQQLATEGVFNKNLISISNDDRLSLFMTKKAAMISAGNWECGLIANTDPEFAKNVYVDGWPGPSTGAKAGKSVEASSAWGIAVSSAADEAKIPFIIDFLANYITNDEFGAMLAEARSSFVPYDFDFDESKVNEITIRQLEAAKTQDKCLNWDSALHSQLRELHQTLLQELLIGSVTPEDYAKQMQEEYESILAEQ